MISQQYIASIALLAMALLKTFGIEIENTVLEGLIGGALALWIAIRRKMVGDISLLGVKQ